MAAAAKEKAAKEAGGRTRLTGGCPAHGSRVGALRHTCGHLLRHPPAPSDTLRHPPLCTSAAAVARKEEAAKLKAEREAAAAAAKLEREAAAKAKKEAAEAEKLAKELAVPPLERCGTILQSLTKRRDASWFLEPVPPDTEGYADVISAPMDYGTIGSKLAAGAYTDADAFAADVRLVASNAVTCTPRWPNPPAAYPTEVRQNEN